jgi:hypothetical protein
MKLLVILILISIATPAFAFGDGGIPGVPTSLPVVTCKMVYVGGQWVQVCQ